MGSQIRSLVGNSFEDLEKFCLGNFSVVILVDSINHGIHFLTSGLPSCSHLVQSSVYEVRNLSPVEGVASVFVKLSENRVNSISQFLIGVSHS